MAQAAQGSGNGIEQAEVHQAEVVAEFELAAGIMKNRMSQSSERTSDSSRARRHRSFSSGDEGFDDVLRRTCAGVWQDSHGVEAGFSRKLGIDAANA